ncbi:TrkA family potassium uptake protein [Serratia sp. UGAL515B_01]|uniref:potassium channel family protein n=1 Tax=Serratia sp. UGAL515B_01 TaxID=2986763 RepID=UPI002953A1B4|nr:TrkA family potassium uptake protein [Serratia sp. UGAL515B_01]WON76988.1 TrkA family potassium uptake protein [Serratia sp. UGAL515B_01]
MAQFAVIGLGRFGSTVSLELIRLGHQVLGVDSEPKFINRLADKLSYAVIADATDEQALAELDLLRYDAVVVAIGEDLEASILCVLHLKNLGVQQLWVKASSKPHHTILSRLGVSRIIHPEEEMGLKVAQSLNYPMINQYLSLGHNQYLVEILVNKHLEGALLSTLMTGSGDEVKTVLVKRHGKLISPVPDNFILETDDSLVLAGPRSMLKSLAPRLA